MPSKGKILFLTISGRSGASSRYRVYQFLPYLERAGFAVEVRPPSGPKGKGIARLLRTAAEEAGLLRAASGADVVFIQKRLFSKGFIRRLERLGKKVVFDLDDSIFTSPKGDWSGPTRRKVQGRLAAVLSASDVVVAGNSFIAAYARRNGAARVEVLPTAVDADGCPQKEHAGDGPPVVGWIGSSVNHPYLDTLSGALSRLSEEMPGTRLLVVSDAEYSSGSVEVENRRWSEKTETADLLDMDIGLMPLEDNDWTRGKCALKALQYMACGIPAVASPVGANVEVIADGVEGYLPGDEDGWVDAVRALAGSPVLRTRMGAAGRKKVLESYSVRAVAPRLAGLVGSLLE